MEILRSISELRRWRNDQPSPVGFVPTMGALHQGHASLIEKSVSECSRTVVSIFVNPTQFGPNEDLGAYPRTWDLDCKMVEAIRADAIFYPAVEEIYPKGFSTYVEETRLSLPLCGANRPGHFKGVTTVVLKLFNLVQPDRAYFGLKDAQQFLVIRKMVIDLNLPLEVIGEPTVREADGLAMSSRNVYLSPDERELAPLLYRELQSFVKKARSGGSIHECRIESQQVLETAGFSLQYFDLRNTVSLDRVKSITKGNEYIVAVAAFLGKTRLIDNVIFRP